MYGIQVEQDINCRTVGRCTYGAPLDREILDLIPRQDDGQTAQDDMTIDERYNVPLIPLSKDLNRHFLYARYNADLSRSGLNDLGFSSVNAAHIQKMDAVDNIPVLTDIGRAAGEAVDAAHFGAFL